MISPTNTKSHDTSSGVYSGSKFTFFFFLNELVIADLKCDRRYGCRVSLHVSLKGPQTVFERGSRWRRDDQRSSGQVRWPTKRPKSCLLGNMSENLWGSLLREKAEWVSLEHADESRSRRTEGPGVFCGRWLKPQPHCVFMDDLKVEDAERKRKEERSPFSHPLSPAASS